MMGGGSLPLSSLINTQGLENLKLGAGVQEQAAEAESLQQKRIGEVAEQFETVFMSMILKQMRSSLSEGLFSGDESDVYGGMFDMYMGQSLAGSRQLGIATAIERYFQNQQASEIVESQNGHSKKGGDGTSQPVVES